MAIVESPSLDTVIDTDGNLVLSWLDRNCVLHRQWLRHRSTEPDQIDPTNRQRLFTPGDIADDLRVDSVAIDDHVIDDQRLVLDFSDGHRARLQVDGILRAVGWVADTEEPPSPVAWTQPLADFPYVDWSAIGWEADPAAQPALVELLEAFFRHGYVVARNTPAAAGTVRRVAERLGYLVGNNFGEVFDVRYEPRPTDLAYTSIELLAHTDQPYKQPQPGIQMLHCIANDAPGGDSTLVDGLACYEAMRAERPDLFEVACRLEVEYRYDMGTDTVVDRGFTFELDNRGRFQRMRYNTKLDEPVVTDRFGGPDLTSPRRTADLDLYYEGRRWLSKWLNDPAHQVTFRLVPGDVMIMDNHRVLHGRTAFDAGAGPRHLQGCYVEHDRPNTLYRLARRSTIDA